MQSTTNYDMFKFREDNRTKIDPSLVRTLVRSIQSRNLLEYKPIIVNENYEIMDGQHRTLAAKELGVPIFYVMEKQFTVQDMLALQTQKSWTTPDIVNAYAKNGYVEYQKLIDFSKASGLPLTVILGLFNGRKKTTKNLLKSGEYTFIPDRSNMMYLDYCKDITNYIISEISPNAFTKSTRFWRSLSNIVKHPSYNHEKMMKNLSQLIVKVSAKADYEGYLDMFVKIHNWKNHFKIEFNDDRGDEE